MKKIISVILTLALFVTPLVSFGAKSNDDNIEEVLEKVLEKITVPEEYTNLESDAYDYDGEIDYYFCWTNPNSYGDDSSIDVSCDSKGRIQSYSGEYYGATYFCNAKKQDVIDYTVKVAADMFPEAFVNENDKLVVDESSYYVSFYGNFTYNVTFNRIRNSLPVEYNRLDMSVSERDGELTVIGAYITYDYDDKFVDTEVKIEDVKITYFDEIPLELIYTMEYSEDESDFVPSLAYYLTDDSTRYLDLSTGKGIVAEYDIYNPYYDFNYRYDVMYPAPEYIDDPVEGLLSADTVADKIKNVPGLKYMSSGGFDRSYLTKEWNDKYYYWFDLVDEQNGAEYSAGADAKTGKLVYVNNYIYDEEYEEINLDSKTIADAEKKIDTFLNSVCKEEYSQYIETSSYVNGYIVTKIYTRIVNGLEFKADYITVEYNTKTDSVQYYNMEFTDIEIPEPTAVVTFEEAEKLITDNVEFEELYTYNGGKYVKAVIPKALDYVDAMTGEVFKYDYSSMPEEILYNDISGHWVEEAALRLAEVNIGIPGGMLDPEKDITLGEFSELMFLNGIIREGEFYFDYYDTDSFIDSLKSAGLVSSDANRDSTLTREDAFKLLVNYMGHGEVAKLDIYKVDYADSYLLSDGKVGYAAILSGMGIISGDGSYLYPNKNITRAETIAMLYKYIEHNYNY